MPKLIVLLAFSMILCTGCCTTAQNPAQKAYQISSIVTPLGVDGQYKVDIVVSEPGGDGSTILSTPTILVQSGKEGLFFAGSTSITKSGEEEIKDGVSCSVLVSEHSDDVEAKVSVIIEEKGRETHNTTQTITVKK